MLRGLSASLPRPLDVLVAAARPDGFKRVFLGEHRWHAVKVNPRYLAQLKYLAPYVSAPVSAITHYAPIATILPWEGGPRFVVNLAAPPIALVRPIRLTPGGRLRSIQDRRYTWLEALLGATTLDEVFAVPGASSSHES